jgi:hypothetical protein
LDLVQRRRQARYSGKGLFSKRAQRNAAAAFPGLGGDAAASCARAWTEGAPLEMASIAIRPEIRVVEGILSGGDLALLSKWIEINRDVLLRYWEGDIDTKDAVEAIQSIG